MGDGKAGGRELGRGRRGTVQFYLVFLKMGDGGEAVVGEEIGRHPGGGFDALEVAQRRGGCVYGR